MSRKTRILSSIDVLFRAGVLVNTSKLLEAERIAQQQPKLARKVAFDMAREEARGVVTAARAMGA